MNQLRSLGLVLLAAAAASAAPVPPAVTASPTRAGALAPLFAAGQGQTRAVLVLDDGRLVAQRYAPGFDAATPMISWSMAKTITGLLVGALVGDGRLDLDAPAPIAEWHQRADDPRGRITLRQLMTMSSGLRHVEGGDAPAKADTIQALFGRETDAVAAAGIAAPLAYAPGTHWEYSSLTSVILSEIVTRTLTDSRDPRARAAAYRRFAETRLFAPAGIRHANLQFDAAGTQIGGSLIYMPADDWARLGMVLLDGRGPDGRTRIVDPAWLRFMKSAGAGNPEYGAQMWRNGPTPTGAAHFPGAPADTAAAEGFQGQFVTVSPTAGHGRGMVVVRLGLSSEEQTPAIRRAIAGLLVEPAGR